MPHMGARTVGAAAQLSANVQSQRLSTSRFTAAPGKIRLQYGCKYFNLYENLGGNLRGCIRPNFDR